MNRNCFGPQTGVSSPNTWDISRGTLCFVVMEQGSNMALLANADDHRKQPGSGSHCLGYFFVFALGTFFWMWSKT